MRFSFLAASVAVWLASSSVGLADVQGVCVSGCVIPPPPTQTQPVWQDPQQLYRAYLGNAQTAMRDGAFDSAYGWAQRALQENPNSAEARAIIAQVEGVRRRRTATAMNNEGVRLSNGGDYANAAARYRDALALDPSDKTIQKNLEYANRWLALQSMSNASERAAAAERLNHQQAVAVAQRAAEQKSQTGLGDLADGLSGLAWTPCEGLACAQAAIARRAGSLGVAADTDEGASAEARIPFDDDRSGITVIPPGGAAPVKFEPRPAGGEAAAIRGRIEAFERQEAVLKKQIAAETDSLKRAVLIQEETLVRSRRHVETIKYVTFTSRYAPDTKGTGK
ncbi:MAG: hypothetical protein GC190_11870 [Alphaproteobacteria bacterium]|nr:hypothetical protein [Alphaproteobacteria bacterium]